MKHEICRYKLDDIPVLLDLVKLFLHEARDGTENYFAGVAFNREKVEGILHRNFDNPRFFCNIVRNESGEIIGGLAGMINEFVFSRDLAAKDWLLFMKQGTGDVRTVIRLITSFVTWAKVNGASEVHLCNSTGYKQEQFAALMKIANFAQFEVGFSRRF